MVEGRVEIVWRGKFLLMRNQRGSMLEGIQVRVRRIGGPGRA